MKRVLLLGAGRVSRPLVRRLAADPGVALTVASLYPEEAAAALAGGCRGAARGLDARDGAALRAAVAGCDLAVSLLPATEHIRVAQACLELGKHLATSSYIGPEMAALGPAAAAKGLVFLNECGLDPGLDHMSALRLLRRVRARGGAVVSFLSCCGGLPAPEAAGNPLKYKFSWAPRGVLLAAGQGAKYLRDGRVVEVAPRELFAAPELLAVPGAGSFELYPNRDSLKYVELYGLPGVRGMMRGTCRYPGHCATWHQWSRLGLFDPSPLAGAAGLTRAGLVRRLAGGGGGPARGVLAARLGVAAGHPALAALEWLGMFEEEPLASGVESPLDLLAERMVERCRYAPGERDLVVLHHRVEALFPEGRRELTSTLVEYGDPDGDTAMARTVALPLSIAVEMILRGEVRERGVVAPLAEEIVEPVLRELERLGIRCREEERAGPGEGPESAGRTGEGPESAGRTGEGPKPAD